MENNEIYETGLRIFDMSGDEVKDFLDRPAPGMSIYYVHLPTDAAVALFDELFWNKLHTTPTTTGTFYYDRGIGAWWDLKTLEGLSLIYKRTASIDRICRGTNDDSGWTSYEGEIHW